MTSKYDALLAATQREFPRFKVVPKADSFFMKFLALLLFFNKQFMTGFITTIGNRMWTTPDFEEWSDDSRAALLRHERVHLRQQVRYGMIRYALMYLLWPLPFWRARGRMTLELEAYTESMAAYAEYWGVDFLLGEDTREGTIRHFTSAEYGWMWTKRSDIEKWYDQTVESLQEPLR